MGYRCLVVLTTLTRLSLQAEDVVINSYPSNQFSEAPIIDVRNKTGLYIRQLGHLALTEFEYKIILPLPIPKSLEEIRNVISRAHEINSTYYQMAFQGLALMEDLKGKYAKSHQNSGQERELEKAKPILHNVTQITSYIIQSAKILEWQLNTYLRAYHAPAINKEKRGLFDGIGTALSYAFGLATHKDLEQVKKYSFQSNQKLVNLIQSSKSLMSIATMQRTEIDQIKANQDLLSNTTRLIIDKIAQHTTLFGSIKREQQRYELMQTLQDFKIQSLLTLQSIREEMSSFFENLQIAKSGSLSPMLIEPNIVNKIIDIINHNLPSDVEIPAVSDEGDLYLMYQIIKAELVTSRDHKPSLIMSIPLIYQNEVYPLLHVTNLPKPLHKNTNITFEIPIANNKIFGVELNNPRLFELTYDDLSTCKTWRTLYICGTRGHKSIKTNKANCLLGILKNALEGCVNLTKQINPNNNISRIEHLKGGKYAFSIRGEVQTDTICSDSKTLVPTITKGVLSGYGEMELRPHCYMKIDDRTIRPFFEKQLLVAGKFPQPVRINFYPFDDIIDKNLWDNSGFDIKSSDLQRLENMKKELKTFAEQTNVSGISTKVHDVLKHTEKLIKNLKPMEPEWWSMTAPSGYEIINWTLIFIIIVLILVVFFYLKAKSYRQVSQGLEGVVRLLRKPRQKKDSKNKEWELQPITE